LSRRPLTGFEGWKESDVSHKINELNAGAAGAASSVGTSRTSAPGVAGTGAAPDGAEAPAVGGDVHITDTAARLALLEPALREAPAVDGAKVATIRAAIESGQYTVQPEHVAAQLLQIEQALGPLRGGAPVAPLTIPASTEEK
jgi:negative regulator of flagellin synthesis FlgM